MEPEDVDMLPESNSLLVHPFVAEPASRFEAVSVPVPHVPQFSEASSMILCRIKSNGSLANAKMDTDRLSNKDEDEEMRMAENDDLTLELPEDVPSHCTTLEEEFVFDNDYDLETADVNFAQDESIPFRPPYEPVKQDDESAAASAAPAVELSRDEAIAAKRREWLAGLPEGVALPAKPELVGFGAGRYAADSTLTNYFYGKSKTDLLNILSFCDQLEPQLLVDLSVSVSKRHPDLPMFDAPDWEDRVRAAEEAEAEAAKAAAATALARTKTQQRPRHGHTLLNPRMRKRRAVRKVVEIAAVAESVAKRVVIREEESEIDDDDVLPPTWHKAGKGLYAKLIPDNRDRLYLEEDEGEAFSHFMVDGLGNLTALVACG